MELRRTYKLENALNSYDQPFIGASKGSFEFKQSFEVMQKVVRFDLVGQMNVLSLIN